MPTPTDRHGRGLLYILVATGVAGVVGYAIQLLAPAMITRPSDYLLFAVFWSTVYLASAAIGGVQQEIARATRPADAVGTQAGDRVLRSFLVYAVVIVLLAATAIAVGLGLTVFRASPFGLGVWFVVGSVFFLLMAVLSGVLYGLGQWAAVAMLVITDAVVRGVVLLAAFALHAPAVLLAAGIVLPVLVAVVFVWLGWRRGRGGVEIDVDLRTLIRNVGTTVLAAAATGVMVTGLPLLLRATLPQVAAVQLAAMVLVITVTRAPLIIPLMALQSYLIVHFQSIATASRRLLLRYLALAAAVGVVAVAVAYVIGPPIITFISAGRYTVTAPVAAITVGSAALVALMCITGPALLARRRHGVYVGGWVVSAVVTVVMLALPLGSDVEAHIMWAITVAPVIGLAVHMAASVRRVDPVSAAR